MSGALRVMMTAAIPAPTPYVANAVDFNGSADYLSRPGFAGQANSPTGIFSAWLRIDGTNGAQQRILNSTSSFFIVQRNASNQIQFTVQLETIGSFDFRTAGTYTTSATWRHVLASWNTNFGAGLKVRHLYVNDVADHGTVSDTRDAQNAFYTHNLWGVAARASVPDIFFNGALAEFYFAPGQYLDFSITANRRKFISSAGKPVSLGPTGALPTGSQPILYLPNAASTVGTNKGTGGDMTIFGAPAVASSSPST
jgi:hypothetical protein